MRISVVFVYISLLVVMAAATIVEHFRGSEYALENIYHSKIVLLLWCVLSVLTLAVLFSMRMWRRMLLFLIHISFIVILSGAAITHFSGKKGYVHLRTDVPAGGFVEEDSRMLHDLPFTLTLDTFYVECHAGTEMASDYVSRIICRDEKADSCFSSVVSMNNVFVYRDYRFCQASYDEDNKGSWLSVNHDPWGVAVTYAGYILMALSMVLYLLLQSRMLKGILLRVRRKRCCLLMLSVLLALPVDASKKLFIQPAAEADSMASMQVIYNGRVAPFNTLARDFVLKISGTDDFGGLSAEQVVCSWLMRPEEWMHVPIIKIKSSELRHHLNLGDSPFVPLVSLVDSMGFYRLNRIWHSDSLNLNANPQLRQAILETDEKVALIGMLIKGTLIKPAPADGSVELLSPWRVRAELLYNSIPFSKLMFMFNLTIGLLAFLASVYESVRRIRCARLAPILHYALLFSLLVNAFSYGLRWYISSHLPMGNGFETLQLLSLLVLLFSYIMRHRMPFVVVSGFILSGFIQLVSFISHANPQITPLMPVLASPWLCVHVTVIMVSYALLALIFLTSLFALFAARSRTELMRFCRRLLLPAVFMLGIGIFVGAVWANESWGRYWAWDPKETWALITFMIYSIPLHGRILTHYRSPLVFHLFMVCAFLSVIMTYFGVNYILGGLHSYG